MNKENDNNELDELLRSMPKFTDNRSKEEVFNRLLKDMAEDEKRDKTGKGRPQRVARWGPILISIASVLLLTVLVSSFMDTQQESSLEVPQEAKEEPGLFQNAAEQESIENHDSPEGNDMRITEGATHKCIFKFHL